MKKKLLMFASSLTLLVGCAGWERDCNSRIATQLGADWIVGQYGMDGKPFNCWKLKNTGIKNEENTDGIYWQDGDNLVHISGWYSRVQVVNGDFDKAATKVGVDANRCGDGRYEPETKSAEPK